MEAFIWSGGGVSVLFDDPPEFRASSDSGRGGGGGSREQQKQWSISVPPHLASAVISPLPLLASSGICAKLLFALFSQFGRLAINNAKKWRTGAKF